MLRASWSVLQPDGVALGSCCAGGQEGDGRPISSAAGVPAGGHWPQLQAALLSDADWGGTTTHQLAMRGMRCCTAACISAPQLLPTHLPCLCPSTPLYIPLQARSDVDAKRARLAKLRGTPGVREERVAEAERDLGDAQQRAEAAKATYEVGAGLLGLVLLHWTECLLLRIDSCWLMW